jgi:hypothetical protein
MRASLLALTFALTLALALAPAAQAGWFRAEAIDGPAEIESLGDVDVARDGGGGVVYLKREGGVPQVFLSRLVEGAWAPPQRLSAGAPVSEAAITATEGGRLAVAWIAGGEVLATVIRGAGAPAPPVVLGGGATGLDLDMGINEVAYAVWSAAEDVRAARLVGTAWTPLAAALDLDPARSAGTGSSRPRVAVSAEGNAVATWGEQAGDARTHVIARRLTGLTPSAFPQDLTLDAFEGQPAGAADSPDIDIEDDGSFAWVAFRQDAGGRSRTFARRLRGSLFEDPFAIDAGATSGEPQIDFNGRGMGGAVAATADNAVFSAYLDKFDAFQAAVRIDRVAGATAPSPVVATSERADVYAAWRTGGVDGSGDVRARRKNGERGFEPEFVASNPDFGAVPPGQLAIGADTSGNAVVAMLQGGPGARRLTAAVYDRLPGRPVVLRSSRPRGRKPLLKWGIGSERWGPQRFTVLVDGRPIGTTTDRARLRSKRALRPGTHRLQVRTTDRRGQVAVSRVRTFVVKQRRRPRSR